MPRLLPINYNSKEAEIEFRNLVQDLPNDVSMYMVGGALRNALIRHYQGEILKQRDYDQVITAGTESYIKVLESRGYVCRPYPGRTTQVVYSKALNDEAIKGDSYENWLVFDIHKMDGTTIANNLKDEVGLTVNGFAIKAQDIFAGDWEERLIVLPGALEDIKKKRLRINPDGYKHQAANFYAVLRFMSAGFSPPSPEEVQLLLKQLPRIESERFDRNVKKVWDYVGGEEVARRLVGELGVTVDVFDEAAVKLKLLH